MPSLDGYSLNKKMDNLHEDVQGQIDQLRLISITYMKR